MNKKKIRHVYTISRALKCEKPPREIDSFGGLATYLALIKSTERPIAHQYWFIEPEWANRYDGDDVGYSG